MSLRVIIGRSNTGKSSSVIGELCSRASAREPVTLLVPSAPDVSRAMELIATRAPLGAAVKTMDGYLDELWARHGDGRSIITPVQRFALVEESGNTCQASWAAVSHGSAGVAALVERVVQRAAESSSFDSAKLPAGPARDLGAWISAYQRLLQSASLIERGDAHNRIAGLLAQITLPALIALDGFTGLTAGQEVFLVRAAASTDVVLALTFDERVPATSAASALVKRLAGVGDVVSLPDKDGAESELEAIARGLGDAHARASARGALILSEAWGRAAESARIVREVQQALADGYEPGEVAVVFRDVAPHLQDLRRAFAEAGIPAAFDAKIAFGSSGFGRALTAVLQLDALSHNQLMDLLRSPYVPAQTALLDQYDAYARGTRRSGARAAQEWFDRHDERTSAFLKTARKAVADGEPERVERRWYALVSHMLEIASSRGTDLLQDGAVARVFVDAVAGLREAGARSLTASALGAVVRHASVVLADGDERGRVRVMGAERARGGRYGCLVLGGLNAGEFPRMSREDALSEQEMAAAFRKAGVDVAQRSGHEDERLLFYQVVTRATDRLVLSRQSHDEDGRPLRGSIFLDEVLDLYRDPLTGEYFDGEPPVHRLGLDGLAADPQAPLTERRQLREQALRVEPAEPRVLDARARSAGSVMRLSDGVRSIMRERETLSASELEAYLQCPYRWAIERLVQPRELDERVDQAAAGRLGHDIMRRFYELLPEETGSLRVTDATLAEALQLHDTVSRECLERLGPLTALDAIACRTVVRRTAGVVESDASLLPGFVPIAHEWAFGLSDGDEPESFEGFSLKGRVDRIDSDGERLVLTDYKSGVIGAEHGAAHFEREGIVQLPLYAAVAERRFGKPVAAAIYRSFRGGKPRGLVREDLGCSSFVRTDVVAAEQAEEQIESAVARAAAAASRMRAGEIPPEPRNGACPAYCSAHPFCRGGQTRA